jgi:hypothetical protein
MILAARALLPMCVLATVLVAACSDVTCTEDINVESKGPRRRAPPWTTGSPEAMGVHPSTDGVEDPRPRDSDVVFLAESWEITVGHAPAGGFVVYETACSTAP